MKDAQSCPTLYSPWNSPGQNTDWVAIPFSQPGDGTRSSALQADSLPAEPPGRPLNIKRWLSVKENQITQVKEFSAFLCMGRWKTLDSLKSSLCWCISALWGSVSCFHILSSSRLNVESGCSLMTTRWWVFSFLSPQGSQLISEDHSGWCEEELKSLLIKGKEESEKADWKLNIQSVKIMTSSPITS